MQAIQVTIMSGVEDGVTLSYDGQRGDGQRAGETWTISIGRKDDNDIVLRHDTYVSRQHAKLHFLKQQCWLEDCNSTNGTFIENAVDYFNDQQVTGMIPITLNQLFRIGRTWMRIEPKAEADNA
jgi:hypothetical protein